MHEPELQSVCHMENVNTGSTCKLTLGADLGHTEAPFQKVRRHWPFAHLNMIEEEKL